MKCIVLVALLVYSTLDVVTSRSQPCLARLCPANYRPVCGEQFVRKVLDRKMFSNQCMLEAANDCGQANYKPCSGDISTL